MFENKLTVTRERPWGSAASPAAVEITVSYGVEDPDGALAALNEAYAEARRRIEAKP